MTQPIRKVAMIGLGKMGAVLAQRLLVAHFDVMVYNRTAEKAQPLILAGAKAAASAREAAAHADVILTCLFDDQSVLDIVQGEHGILAGMQPTTIHIGVSTILPVTSQLLTQLHQQHDTIYLAGTVLGVPLAAAKGELTTLVAGDQQAVAHCTPIFNAYSNNILNVGAEANQANTMKICCNYLLKPVDICSPCRRPAACPRDPGFEYLNFVLCDVEITGSRGQAAGRRQ